MRHGSESFFVEGEGLLDAQVGGRSGEEADPLEATDNPRPARARALAATEAPPFRFVRVGPKGNRLGVALTRKLANAMTVGAGGESDIPAGYTYLGQFVDHDLTMDKTKVRLGEEVSPADLLQARSPSLDLDSLYGDGPASEGSAKFYEADGLHLKTGRSLEILPDRAFDGHDLPRVGTGRTAKAKRTALIPDPRNDENLIVAQTHLAMIRFHNRVADQVRASVPQALKFDRARKRVTLHYQWMLRHDFLPRVVRPDQVDAVWDGGRVLVEPEAGPTDVPAMPIEFSVAAFRFGHAMVRETYNWNRRFPGDQGSLDWMFFFSGAGGELGGDLRLASNWLPDWRRMYDFPAGGRPALVAPDSAVNRAMRIDTRLTNPLRFLPASTFGGTDAIDFDDARRNLAFRNLIRSTMLRVASGQQMVRLLKNRGVDIKPLTRTQILDGNNGAKLDHLTASERDRMATRTPLWFYVLREAEHNGGVLRGVGGRIVAETFHRAMEGSRFSILRAPDWRPTLGRGETFEMTDLLFFAFGGTKKGLNPIGRG